MEILLAIVVASAVILFGALISLGNERQRKAIDDLREQIVLWAMQDLKIKREHLARTVQVADPLDWLNKVASRVCNYDRTLHVMESFNEPPALICGSDNADLKVVFSPLSPVELRRIKNGKQNRLTQYADHNPLLSLPRNVTVHELSVLNEGYLFDLELSLAWKALTGHELDALHSLWVYQYV